MDKGSQGKHADAQAGMSQKEKNTKRRAYDEEIHEAGAVCRSSDIDAECNR